MRFEHEVDPDGEPWAALRPSTILKKAKAVRVKKLQWSGRLRDSITSRVDSNSVTVGTNLAYAAIHQFGGTIDRTASSQEVLRHFTKTGGVKKLGSHFVTRKKANFSSVHKVPSHVINIPARPFLGINADDEVEAVHILRTYIFRDMR